MMRNFMLSCLLALLNTVMAQQTPFLDPMFNVADLENGQLIPSSSYNNIVYGTGAINGAGSGEMQLQLDLYHPSGAGLPAQLPGVIFIHGGGFWSGTKEDLPIRMLAIEYAKRGYIAASIGYRLNGVNPDEGNPAAAVNDATKAMQWMIAQAYPGGATEKLMTDKIVIGGGSAGAITSLMQGCSNLHGAKPKVILNFWGGLLNNDDNYIDATDPAIFTVHGTDDDEVNFSNATNLCARLDQQGIRIPYKLFTLAGQPHSPWNTVFNTVVDGRTIFQHSVDFAYGHLALGTVPSNNGNAYNPGQPQIGFSGNKLVIHWKGQPGKTYDLLSNVQLDSPSSTWPTYSEVVNADETLVYENIPSGGNSTIVMTPFTSPVDPTRFFVVREN